MFQQGGGPERLAWGETRDAIRCCPSGWGIQLAKRILESHTVAESGCELGEPWGELIACAESAVITHQ